METADFEELAGKLGPVTEEFVLLIHRSCGQPAFWLARRVIETNALMTVECARDLEGQVPNPHTTIQCFSCKSAVAPTHEHLQMHELSVGPLPGKKINGHDKADDGAAPEVTEH